MSGFVIWCNYEKNKFDSDLLSRFSAFCANCALNLLHRMYCCWNNRCAKVFKTLFVRTEFGNWELKNDKFYLKNQFLFFLPAITIKEMLALICFGTNMKASTSNVTKNVGLSFSLIVNEYPLLSVAFTLGYGSKRKKLYYLQY